MVSGGARKLPGITEEMDLVVEVFVDGQLIEEAILPTLHRARRHDITWKYNLEDGDHDVRIIWKNPVEGYKVEVNKVIIYGPDPAS